MKKCLYSLLLILYSLLSFSQNSDIQINKEQKHLVSIGYSDGWLAQVFNVAPYSDKIIGDFSLSYIYHPIKYIGVGLNFVSYFGKDYTYYNHTIYNVDGSVSHESIETPHTYYSFAIAPEIRGRYLNKSFCSLYSGGSIGYAYNAQYKEHNLYWQLTFLGFDVQLGKKNNFVIGMELGVGMKGFINGHIGWRF